MDVEDVDLRGVTRVADTDSMAWYLSPLFPSK